MADRVPRYDLRQRPAVSLATQAIARGVVAEPPDVRSQARITQLLGPTVSNHTMETYRR